MSEFSDRPFVAGSLVGLRAFRVDTLGRLVGPSYPQVFRPGENVAECRKPAEGSMSATFALMHAQLARSIYRGTAFDPFAPLPSYTVSAPGLNFGPISQAAPDPDPAKCPCGCGQDSTLHAKEIERKHTLGGVGCSCGFYAYFDGRNDYKEPTNAAAVIEGYGVCTVGTRGFRASKARLLAIIEPKAKVAPMLRDYLHRNYEDVPFFATRREAVAQFPLTPPTSDITPDAEDFWDREAPR